MRPYNVDAIEPGISRKAELCNALHCSVQLLRCPAALSSQADSLSDALFDPLPAIVTNQAPALSSSHSDRDGAEVIMQPGCRVPDERIHAQHVFFVLLWKQ